MNRNIPSRRRLTLSLRRFFPVRSSPKRRALTLVEVLVALTLLIVGLGGVTGLLTREMKNLGLTKHRAKADYLARGYLAQIQSLGYENLKNDHLKGSTEAFFGPNLNTYPENPVFKWNARLKTEGGDGQGEIPRVKIAVRVWWGQTPAQNRPKMDDAAKNSLKIREVVGYAVAP